MASSPSGNGSNCTIIWQPEPTTRGTFTLLSTCIITLSLCVWSSVHLNLPGNSRYYGLQSFRRLFWIVGALLVPEYVILTAWTQRQRAIMLFNEVKKTFQSGKKADHESQNLPTTRRRHQWTITHSFWAIMGGIAVLPNSSPSFIPYTQRSTLTPNGVSFLLKHEPKLLPDISEVEIKDKSKGSSVTKSLACIQATWFCLSCVARISQQLHVSMLELNTFAHALCVVIVYILWWRKPLDIEQPIIVQDDRMEKLLAFMWMASKTSCIPKPTKYKGHNSFSIGRDPEFEAIVDMRQSSTGTTADSETSQNPNPKASGTALDVQSTNTRDPSTAQPQHVTVTTTQDLPSTGFRVNAKSTRWIISVTECGSNEFDGVYTHEYHEPAVFNLTSCDVRRWQLAREAMDAYNLEKPNTNLDLVTVKPVPEFVDLEALDNKPKKWAHLGFSLVMAGYGGLHTLAWNAPFPTRREQVLWRISALVIVSPAALYILSQLVFHATLFTYSMVRVCHRKLGDDRMEENATSSQLRPTVVQRSLPRGGTRVKRIGTFIVDLCEFLGPPLLVLPVCGLLFLYVFARGYLVYESFRTVFFLPPAAYVATKWTQYLPHIT